MSDLIDKDGVINIDALSKYNGKTGFENIKMIALFLTAKGEFFGTPQRMHLKIKIKEPKRD